MYLGYNYLEPTLVFTQISPESVMADTCRGVIVGLAPPPDTLHRVTRVHLYKETKILLKKNQFTWVMIISSMLGINIYINNKVVFLEEKQNFGHNIAELECILSQFE